MSAMQSALQVRCSSAAVAMVCNHRVHLAFHVGLPPWTTSCQQLFTTLQLQHTQQGHRGCRALTRTISRVHKG